MRPRPRLRRRLRTAFARLPVIGQHWDQVARRRWLLESLPAGSIGAEIGVWQGDFSASIITVTRPVRLHLIDPWRSATDQDHAGALYARSQDEMNLIHAGVVARFVSEIASGMVTIIRAPSSEAASEIADASLDWVYIDGDHAYEAVRDDIGTYARKVRPGGLVTGDNYTRYGMFGGGVKQAVDEAVASGALTLVTLRDHQFVLRRDLS